jgi:hypothetical protein
MLASSTARQVNEAIYVSFAFSTELIIDSVDINLSQVSEWGILKLFDG